MLPLSPRRLVAMVQDLLERWRPSPESRALVRVAEHGPYLIRHHRRTGLAEVLNRRRRQVSCWESPSFHQAVADARDRLDAEAQGFPVLRNPWLHEWRLGEARR